jgi:hypothetical protein
MPSCSIRNSIDNLKLRLWLLLLLFICRPGACSFNLLFQFIAQCIYFISKGLLRLCLEQSRFLRLLFYAYMQLFVQITECSQGIFHLAFCRFVE